VGKRTASGLRAKAKATVPGRVVQLKVTLRGARPPIWRRVQVPATFSLEKLHYVLQAVMGWEDCHLHQYCVGGVYYSGLAPDGTDVDWDDEMMDEREVTLGDLIKRKDQKLLDEYDMGDGWEHEILVEQLLDPEEGVLYPVCTAGRRACPPEDCGGVWGYEELLGALADPDHPDHEDIAEWAGDFGPGGLRPGASQPLASARTVSAGFVRGLAPVSPR
jgi:hypothetical protein